MRARDSQCVGGESVEWLPLRRSIGGRVRRHTQVSQCATQRDPIDPSQRRSVRVRPRMRLAHWVECFDNLPLDVTMATSEASSEPSSCLPFDWHVVAAMYIRDEVSK